MEGHDITLNGAALTLRPTGTVWWAEARMLIVADLHLCKSERMARRGGVLLPPYETLETLDRLGAEIDRTGAATVLCLGDSFDDLDAACAIGEAEAATLARLQAGRAWLWVEGNHDPGPVDLGGTHLAEHRQGPLVFRHIAEPGPVAGELSGHYHPKARIKGHGRSCFLSDGQRLILPAFGCYTGGLDCLSPSLRTRLGPQATAFLLGRRVVPVPLPALAA